MDIPNATSATYALSMTIFTNVGYYDVIISNSVNTNNSSIASLGVINLNVNSNKLAEVFISGPLGANYRIDTTPALGSTNWTTLTNVTITSQAFIYVDYSTPTNSEQFYRASPQ